jgi:photolyase PhrII
MLPFPVRERVRQLSEGVSSCSGDHVLYWMHHAVRGHENAALDAAVVSALELNVPLLVYQGLGGRHRYNSDRHHTFILEGARALRSELSRRGIVHALWLGEDPGRKSPLEDLARTAALVVTEDFPAPPFPKWTERLASRTSAPVWAVDASCVVPMRLMATPFHRAYRFREAARELWKERLGCPWTEVEQSPGAFDRELLPFIDVDFEGNSIADLVSRCEIDHTVGPVAHTRGGSDAGYERWGHFRDRRLVGYHRLRNDAVADGVSRLSPYLHHGHVSALRIAREAAGVGGPGAEKFLDELLVWRELAHHLCCHRHSMIESFEVLPDWAKDTLRDHASDPRSVLSWERLARGRTGDRLWDLCQKSLLRHGELHNNVRMTWGKAIPRWTESPEKALEMLIDLNHRFALDGSDPNSYGGLLWCLGLFDRPFRPETRVLGSVRSRGTESHGRRLEVDRYAERVLAPATSRPLEVAVVGAGISGLACARVLADHGHEVRVFEKARGVGGRTSTRRIGDWSFDHGAQYFTVRDERFRRLVASWLEDDLVRTWNGRIAVLAEGAVQTKSGGPDRYVGVPGMSAVCGHLAADLEVSLETRVAQPERSGGSWRLRSDDGRDLGGFDALVVSTPAPQVAELLAPAAPAIADLAKAVPFFSCWSVMVVFDRSLPTEFDGAFVDGPCLSWVARDSSKPNRAEAETWVLHASQNWSRRSLDLDPDIAAERLLDAFADAVGGLDQAPVKLSAHRWRFARPSPLDEPCLFDAQRWLAVCGDWCGGPRVEGAFLSGCAAAGRLLSLRPGSSRGELAGDPE